jgi:hypothetical protein
LGAFNVSFDVTDECRGFARIDSCLLVCELSCHCYAEVLGWRGAVVTKKRFFTAFCAKILGFRKEIEPQMDADK